MAIPLTDSEKPRTRQFTAERVLLGAISGAALWLLLAVIQVPQIFGVSTYAGLVPAFVIGMIVSLTRYRFVFPVLSLLLLVLIGVIGYTNVIEEPARSMIRSDSVPRSADAVVVLSAGVTADGLVTQQGADRILKAIELVEQGVAPVLLFTREEKNVRGRIVTVEQDQRRLAALGKLQLLMTTRRVRSTRDEARSVGTIARHRGWKRVVVVTSPMHSRRACAAFEKVGLIVSCVPSDSRDVSLRALAHAPDRIAAFGLWLYETAGTLRYRQAGWI